MNPSTKRVPVPNLLVRGLLVVALPLLVGTCRLSDLIKPPEGALLCINNFPPGTTLRDSAPLGSTARRANPIDISNCGGGVLTWNTEIQGGSPWVAVQPESGTAGVGPPASVVFDPTDLALGAHNEVAVVNSPAASAAQSVPLVFTVYPCKFTQITIDDSASSILTSADCGAPHRDGSFAQIFAFPGTANDSASIELPAGFDSYLALDTALANIRPPLKEGDDCLGTSGDACLYYNLLPRNGTYFVEVTSADSAASGPFKMRLLHPRFPHAPDSLDQRQPDSTTVVDTGATVSQSGVVLRARLSDPDLGDTLHLEAEVKQVGTTFNGSATAIGGEVPNGSLAYVLQTGLIDNADYHWRVRAVDQTGRASSSWMTFGGNPETEADFSVDQPEPPNDATALGQFEGDSTTTIGTGGTARSDTVVLTATVRDNDPGDQLRLLVEVKPLGTNFNGVVSDSSAPVPSNTLAAVRLGPNVLQNNTDYHWRARVVDQTGRLSATWVSYGSNGEGVRDFRIQIPNRPTVSALNQFQSDNTTPIPQGGDANIPTVIFKGTVNDPDIGQTIRLEVEVQSIGTPFANTATALSTFVSSGSVASVSVSSPSIAAGGAYHWQARAVDNTSFPSGWTPYPGTLPDTGTDFGVAIAVSELVFTTQPAIDTAGRSVRPAVVVAARDVNHNVITGFNGQITMLISSNPVGGNLTGTTTVTAANGIATFPNLIIDKAGIGYRLQATTGTVNSLQSNLFNVVAGPATRLAFTANPPGSTQAGANLNIVVTAQDAFANAATSFTGPVTLAITPGTGPGGTTVNNGGPVNAVGGVATFTTANITRTGTGYTLTATSGGLTPDTSTAFNITPGNATHLVFTGQPSNTPVNSPITPPVIVTARDVFNNNATGFTGGVTLAITPGTGAGTLTGGGPVTAVAGVATFGSASINALGSGYTLTASSAGLTPDTSFAFDVVNSQISTTLSTVVAAPTAITVCNTGCSTVAQTLSVITVTARDQSGLPVSGVSATISVAPSAGVTIVPAGAVITNGSGQATWNLTSTSPGPKGISTFINSLSIVDTATVNVSSGTPTSLTITTGPTTTTAGLAINSGSGGVVVTARDQFGNTATSFNASVTMAIVAGPVGGVFAPTSTNPVAASAGVATFSNLRIYKAGTGYQIQASGGALPASLPSGAFNINTAPASRLAFVVQPTTTADSQPITPGVAVAGQDSVGNPVTTFTGQVRMFIDNPGTNPGGGGLSGTTQVNAVSGTGIATFNNLRINARGTGYTLLATASGLTDTPPSDPFDIIAGPASALFFTIQPSQTVAGSPITPAVQVTARDNQGNTATSYFGNVTLDIGANPSGGTLAGGGPLSASAGVVSFPNASINNAGTPYTLTASATGLTGATSSGFTITTGGASASNSTVSATSPITACNIGCTPGGGTQSVITVTAKDALGNPISGATVSLAVISGTSYDLTQPAGVTNASGQITGALSSTLAVEAKTVRATITVGGNPPVVVAQTATINVNAASPTQVQFSRVVGNAQATQTINPVNGVQAEIRDQFGNRVFSATNSVSISIQFNAGGGTLSGTLTATTGNGKQVSGLATFNNLSIDKIGTGYTFLVSSTGLTSDTSNAFNITFGAATRLGFVQPPTNAAGGAPIMPNITVEVQDAVGNRVTSASTSITLTIGTNPNNGSLSGTTTVSAAAGLATFPGVSIDSAGTGYALNANGGGLTQATSAGFTVLVGSAAKLGFRVQPPDAAGGATLTPSVQVEARDAGGNRVTSYSSNVSVAFGANPGNGSLLGTKTVAAASGLATFSGLSIDSAATGYTLNATSGSLTPATSNSFTIAVGTASQLAFRVQPTDEIAGAAISPAVQVEVQDAGGNRVTGYGNDVTVAFGNNPGGAGTLFGTKTVAAASGLATFSTLNVDKAANGYTLTATAVGVGTGATSSGFNIAHAGADHLVFTGKPSNTLHDQPITPAVVVEIRDAFDNLVTNASDAVTLIISTDPSGGAASLSNGGPLSASGGIATFSTLSINAIASGYRLDATASGLPAATSDPFDIN